MPHTCPSSNHNVAVEIAAQRQDKPRRHTLFRCFDCYHAKAVCRACIVYDHSQNPFHRVDVWNEALRFWERMSLGSLDEFVINLGHGGLPCSYQRHERPMTITHERGIASMKVRFCACPGGEEGEPVPDAIQLLRFGLFPGSWKEPRSAYTIHTLRDYDLLAAQCGVSAWDFSAYLRRSTDNVLPESVKVCTFVHA